MQWVIPNRIVLFGIVILTILFIYGCKGEQGVPGISCSVMQEYKYTIIRCPDGTSAIIKDGKSLSIVWVDPCPSIYTQHPELIMYDGHKYHSLFVSGQNIFLNKLKEDTVYKTHDKRHCKFFINGNKEVEEI